jgi:prevent-host-death family protein
MKRLAVAQLKRDFRAVLDAAERGESTIVVRRGRAVAVVAPARGASPDALPRPRRDGGLLALAGLFHDWDSLDQDMAAVVAGRQQAPDRPPPALD